MKKYVFLVLAIFMAATAGAVDSPLRISLLSDSVLCLRASRVPDNVTEQVRAATMPNHLDGTVLDLRFANDAATNAAEYFLHRKSPLVILVNSQTQGGAAALASRLRASAPAVIIGTSNSPVSPDIVVTVTADDERKFQDNPYTTVGLLQPPPSTATNDNLLAFVDHTSEADLVRRRIKDGDSDGTASTPRAEPPQPVIQDPALARAVDLVKALAALHSARG
jgi:hypothetical protein